MNDNKIKKALECCLANENCEEISCEKCPLERCADCKEVIFQKAIDFINRLQAEIGRLQGENERVKSDLASQKYLIERMQQGHSAYVEQAKSEAIKEFANLIKRRLNSNTSRGAYLIDIIDNLVKEMTEGKE